MLRDNHLEDIEEESGIGVRTFDYATLLDVYKKTEDDNEFFGVLVDLLS